MSPHDAGGDLFRCVQGALRACRALRTRPPYDLGSQYHFANVFVFIKIILRKVDFTVFELQIIQIFWNLFPLETNSIMKYICAIA